MIKILIGLLKRALLTADWHFSSYSQDKIDSITKFPERLSGLYNTINNMLIYAKINKINTIIVIGDVFHNKNIIYSIAQSALLDIVRSNKEIQFIFIDGNHDLSSMTGDGVSATKCLDNEPNVITIHETTKIQNALFVPWNPKTMIEDIKKGNEEYLFAHLGLNEGVLNSGISLVSDIGLKDLKNYKRAFLGHYHTPQKIGNVDYIGSLTHMDWNDKNQRKRFIDLNFETGDEKTIYSEGYTKYFEYEINKDNKDEIIKVINEIKSEGHYIKINKTDDSDTSDLDDSFNIIDKREKDITNRGITSGMSTVSKLERFLEIKEIPDDKRVLYKNVALEIINSIQ